MLGKTHVASGIAASLLVLRPATVTGVISAVVGGTIGGWICDIDTKDSEIDEGAVAGLFFTFLIAGCALFLDYKMGNGIYAYAASHWGIVPILSTVAFLGLCMYGFTTSHRTFMHSLVALTLLSALVYFACRPLAVPFLIGFASHLFLDIFNHRGLHLFYPFEVAISFCWLDSDGKANNIILGIATIIAMITAGAVSAAAVIRDFAASNIAGKNPDLGIGVELSAFQRYMLIINIVTFIVFVGDYLVCKTTHWEDDEDWGQDFIHTILSFLGIIGGSFGMLASLIFLRQKIGKHNANWYAVAVSLSIVWAVIYSILVDPFGIGFKASQTGIGSHVILIAYLTAVNPLSMVLFMQDRNTFRPKWKAHEALLFLLGLAGGSLGGLLIITMTGKKRNSPHFSFGFPVLLAAQTFLIAYLIWAGLA